MAKRPLGITTMNAELPPFKNGDHNSENASTVDRVITPSIESLLKHHVDKRTRWK